MLGCFTHPAHFGALTCWPVNAVTSFASMFLCEPFLRLGVSTQTRQAAEYKDSQHGLNIDIFRILIFQFSFYSPKWKAVLEF